MRPAQTRLSRELWACRLRVHCRFLGTSSGTSLNDARSSTNHPRNNCRRAWLRMSPSSESYTHDAGVGGVRPHKSLQHKTAQVRALCGVPLIASGDLRSGTDISTPAPTTAVGPPPPSLLSHTTSPLQPHGCSYAGHHTLTSIMWYRSFQPEPGDLRRHTTRKLQHDQGKGGVDRQCVHSQTSQHTRWHSSHYLQSHKQG